MKSFKQLIEAKKFGEVLFGGFRDLEPDTPREAEIYQLIKDYIIGKFMNGQISDAPPAAVKKLNKGIDDLMKAKKDYKSELDPSKVGQLFRGMEFSCKPEEYQSLWEDFKDDNQNSAGFAISDKDRNIKFKLPIQSFTSDFNIANEFSGSYDSGTRVAMILIVDKINNDFIMNPKFMNNIQVNGCNAPKSIQESEVLRFSKSSLKCKYMISSTAVRKSYIHAKIVENFGKIEYGMNSYNDIIGVFSTNSEQTKIFDFPLFPLIHKKNNSFKEFRDNIDDVLHQLKVHIEQNKGELKKTRKRTKKKKK